MSVDVRALCLMDDKPPKTQLVPTIGAHRPVVWVTLGEYGRDHGYLGADIMTDSRFEHTVLNRKVYLKIVCGISFIADNPAHFACT